MFPFGNFWGKAYESEDINQHDIYCLQRGATAVLYVSIQLHVPCIYDVPGQSEIYSKLY